MAVAEGDICDVLWIVSKSFELIYAMTFYGRLIKITVTSARDGEWETSLRREMHSSDSVIA